MERISLSVCLLFVCGLLTAVAQPRFSKSHGLYRSARLTVAIQSDDEAAEIRYTTDGSTPTAASALYTQPLFIMKTTILRAVEVKNGKPVSDVVTSSYLMMNSVLNLTGIPAGYPSVWGDYTQMPGTAVADYEMDPEMTGDAVLRPLIVKGLMQLPVLSIVSDRDCFFSHVNDPDTGGIYIFTGPPVGDPAGHGWTRPASIELMGGPQQHDLSAACGIRLHGGHGRLAEKNPKHSFRLVFKKEYGKKTLKYPLYGTSEPAQFDQLVLRCHFGNAWQHWDSGNRRKAQYTRDVWARRMQRRLGRTSVNALYVHVFLNGIYWGIYNIAERVDSQFGKNHLGGTKSDIDVIKVEEDGGNHIEAAEGNLEAWQKMCSIVSKAVDNHYYEQLDTLLDIPSFIDYMLINQYGGNTDWAHHNWYAIRRRNDSTSVSEGFKFLCWDTEIIFDNVNENNLSKNDGSQSPTGIFRRLMGNEQFARRYFHRAQELLGADGLLSETSVVGVWDSLYNTLSFAIYAEAARWGDYRRDVSTPYHSNELYTVDNQYMKERRRLLESYFPYRTETVLSQITAFAAPSLTGISVPSAPVPASAVWYDLQGRTVDHPTRGLYIRNKKKVIVK